MKRIFLAGVAVLLLTAPTLGQSTIITTAPAPVITIAPEQRTQIRTYVVERRVPAIPLRERVVVGATLPTEVELVAVPTEWGPDLVRYRYVYTDNRVVLVEPSSRRVIQVIE